MDNAIQLPETGFLRLSQIVGNPKSTPPIPPIYPVSKSSWWAGVKSGLYPPAYKIGPRTTAWRNEHIRELRELIILGKLTKRDWNKGVKK